MLFTSLLDARSPVRQNSMKIKPRRAKVIISIGKQIGKYARILGLSKQIWPADDAAPPRAVLKSGLISVNIQFQR